MSEGVSAWRGVRLFVELTASSGLGVVCESTEVMIIGGLILFVIVFVIAWFLSEEDRLFERLFNSLGWAGAVSAGLFGFVFGGFWGLVIGAFLGFAYAAGSVIAIPMLAAAAVYFAVFMGIVWVGVLVVQGGAGLLGVDSIWVVMTLVGIGFVYLLLFSPISGTDRESIVDKIRKYWR